MSGAAMVMAIAVLVYPARSRSRLETLGVLAPVRRGSPVVPSAVVLAAALAVVLPTGVFAAGAIVGVAAWMRRRRRVLVNRRAAESAALQAALEVLVGELRIGAHPVAAITVAAGEVDGPVSESLRAVAARAWLGADVAAGLQSVTDRSSMPALWERLAVCWRLAEDCGLSIATLMQTAHRDVVERVRFSAKVDAGMAGARTTAAVLAGLPLLGVGLGELIGAKPLSFLLSGGAGSWFLVIGVVLACGGLLWSDRITAQAST